MNLCGDRGPTSLPSDPAIIRGFLPRTCQFMANGLLAGALRAIFLGRGSGNTGFSFTQLVT